MDNIQSLIEILQRDVNQIKWILAAILVFLILLAAGLVVLIVKLKKLDNEEKKKSDFSKIAGDPLDKDDLDQLIKLANDRLAGYPKDLYACWYLAKAYYHKKDWVKSLQEFRLLYEIAPGWRSEYVVPYMEDIKEKLKNSNPEVGKD